MNNEYYETMGMIYESYEEGLISEETKDSLIDKLKKAKDKAVEKIKKVDKKKLAKGALAVGAAIGAGYGAKKVNDKLNKDFDAEQKRKELKATAKDNILKDRKADWKEKLNSSELHDMLADADLKGSKFRGAKKILRDANAKMKEKKALKKAEEEFGFEV